MSNGANSAMNQIHGLAKGKSPVVVMTIAGLLGGIAGYVLSELIQGGDTSRFFPESLYLSTGVWFMLIIAGIGLLLSASQGIIEKNVEKSTSNILTALPALAIGGFISGAVAGPYEIDSRDHITEVVVNEKMTELLKDDKMEEFLGIKDCKHLSILTTFGVGKEFSSIQEYNDYYGYE